MNLALASKIIALMDLTSLNQDDTEEKIRALCLQAVTPYAAVAAVCVYPEFVATAVSALSGTAIKIATVVNFPYGDEPLAQVLNTIRQALDNGADEIDVVIPYQAYINGDRASTKKLVKACKALCQDATLKVILETGALQKPELIAMASRDALESGADFLKTSTGKIPVGATTNAADIMLREINLYSQLSGKQAGFKASGGVKTVKQAEAYLDVAQSIMGDDYLMPEYFRFGASSLLQNVLETISL
ncbi:MAG: deoxyribose-phosphate aldolase [Gammaproteobacteria bacterium]|nr:deoxyribose-phosphate aldolase [Gammaproteobacteria bacterium]